MGVRGAKSRDRLKTELREYLPIQKSPAAQVAKAVPSTCGSRQPPFPGGPETFPLQAGLQGLAGGAILPAAEAHHG